MARLNKTATMELAKKLAFQHPDVKAHGTFEAVEALGDYEARQRHARVIATSFVPPAEVSPANTADFVEAFTSAAMDFWYRIVKTRENARNSWQRLLASKTRDQAIEQVVALVGDMRIRGASVERYSGVTVRVERSFGVSADLYVRVEREDGFGSLTDAGIRNPDDPTQRGGYISVRVELNWSGTSRSISESVASVKLYTELIEAAAEIEAVMARERIRWTFGIPETVPEPVAAE